MILPKQKFFFLLLLNGVSTESNTYLCTSDKAGVRQQEYDSYKCLTCTKLSEAFTFLVENICVIWWHGLSIKMGIPIGKLCST